MVFKFSDMVVYVYCVVIMNGRQIHQLCIDVAVGSSEGLLTQFTEPSLGDRCHRITSVAYSHDSTEVLVSYSSEHVYLFGFKVTAFLLCCVANYTLLFIHFTFAQTII